MKYLFIYCGIGECVMLAYIFWARKYDAPRGILLYMAGILLWPLICLFMLATTCCGDENYGK